MRDRSSSSHPGQSPAQSERGVWLGERVWLERGGDTKGRSLWSVSRGERRSSWSKRANVRFRAQFSSLEGRRGEASERKVQGLVLGFGRQERRSEL